MHPSPQKDASVTARIVFEGGRREIVSVCGGPQDASLTAKKKKNFFHPRQDIVVFWSPDASVTARNFFEGGRRAILTGIDGGLPEAPFWHSNGEHILNNFFRGGKKGDRFWTAGPWGSPTHRPGASLIASSRHGYDLMICDELYM